MAKKYYYQGKLYAEKDWDFDRKRPKPKTKTKKEIIEPVIEVELTPEVIETIIEEIKD